jgi:hypothetical protein
MRRIVLSDEVASGRDKEIKAPTDAGTRAMVPDRNKADGYGTKLLKLVPAEVVVTFVAIDNAIKAANHGLPEWGYWLLTALLTVGAFLYTLRISHVGGLRPAYLQSVLAAVAFLVWVFSIGGPFAYAQPPFSWYTPIWGTVLLPVFTLFAPLLIPDKERK